MTTTWSAADVVGAVVVWLQCIALTRALVLFGMAVSDGVARGVARKMRERYLEWRARRQMARFLARLEKEGLGDLSPFMRQPRQEQLGRDAEKRP